MSPAVINAPGPHRADHHRDYITVPTADSDGSVTIEVVIRPEGGEPLAVVPGGGESVDAEWVEFARLLPTTPF